MNATLHIPSKRGADRVWYNKNPPRYQQLGLSRRKRSPLYVQIGTLGLGRGTFAVLSPSAIHKGVHPIAEIAFSTLDSKRLPIVTRVALRQRSLDAFYDRVFVPEKATAAKAVINLSFPDSGRRVRPTSCDLLVRE